MARFKDKHGHNRFQEAKKDLKDFFQKNGDTISTVAKSIVKVAAPRASHVLQAIEEVKKSRATASAKQAALEHLNNILEDLDDEDAPEESYASVEPPSATMDPTKVVSSTFVSKYIGSAILVMVTLIFSGLWFTEIAFYWGFCQNQVPPSDKATITAAFTALVGIRTITRGDMKKKLIQSISQ